MSESRDSIHRLIREKSTLKQDVFHTTINTFQLLKEVLNETITDVSKTFGNADSRVEFNYKEHGDFQVEVKIAGDILIFQMHTNVFQFDQGNSLWKSSYFKNHEENSYVGVINVYNFLSDSFKYQRINDVGYLIARIFVNREKHYLVQGKRQLGFLYNDFINATLDKAALTSIVDSSILYSLDFDLYTPPYENMQVLTVEEVQSFSQSNNLATGKRLGFRFGLDEHNL